MARFAPLDTFSALAILFGFVDPTAASEAGGDISLDAMHGRALTKTHTATGSGGFATLLLPVNLPDGATMQLLLDPNGNTVDYEAGYEGDGDALPDIADEALLTITRVGGRYLLHLAGENYGDGT